jgi:antitoxin ParD1/3/4
MATTSLSLGPHWEGFIKKQVETGRYGSASEVVRDALRGMEEYNQKREALRAHLDEGLQQAKRGEFVEDFSFEKLIAELDAEDDDTISDHAARAE